MVQASACLDGSHVGQLQYAGASAVYRTAVAATKGARASSNGSSIKQHAGQTVVLSQHRMWYIFDSTSVLPEYLVTFSYTVQPGSPLVATAGGNQAGLVAANSSALADKLAGLSLSKQQDPLLRLISRPLVSWLAASQQQQQDLLGPPAASIDQQLQAGATELEQCCKSLVVAAAAVAPKRQIAVLAPAALSAFIGGKEVMRPSSIQPLPLGTS